MNFQLSEDQEALKQTVRSFCQGRIPAEHLPELEGGFPRALWDELAEMGVFSMQLAEDQGGIGLGSADAVLVFAELGRSLVPGPVVWSHLVGGLVKGAETGETLTGGIDAWQGETEALLIEYLDSLDLLVVLRRTGLFRVDPRTLDGEPLATPLDPLVPVHYVRALPEGERIAGPEEAARLRLAGAALVAAQQLGIAEATLELALAYAKERQQFGRPIGGFQAVKHILADMFVQQEVARAAAYAAGATLDDPEVGDLVRTVSSAKITAGEAAMKNARACIQVHGGMGYTWDVPAHYYLKRAWVLESMFGTREEHCETVAERIPARH